ncbi:hypothetical protein BMF94_4450 [Rhodotorula taiwanensis]|uniref:Allergen n=1 Tax=Rhodotorula taiwanensis TaxID=741276 RepID=A0A2S5B769_9BASI|nr:hypothetical protein BMF94_4450 [Rhodotorula taiwanensis]
MNKIKQVLSHNSTGNTTHGETTHTGEKTHRATGDVVGPPTVSSAGDRVDDAAMLGLKNRDNTVGSNAGTGLRDESALPTTDATHGTHGIHGTGATDLSSGQHTAAHIKESALPPTHGHKHGTRDSTLTEDDAKAAVHDHQHLAPVVHERRHHHEVEEVERVREVDRHVHHVQHHVQPVLDEQHAAEQVHQKVVPRTEIRESHAATDEDKHQFLSLNTVKDEVVEAPRERTIIDKGEVVKENVHHVVHHVVQPVIERDTHEHHRIRTTIPVHHTVVEAPIVHASVQHEPLSLKDFVAGGGDLKSTLRHDPETLLNHGKCERTVEGPAETLVQQMGLSSLNDSSSTTSGMKGSSLAGSQGTTGLTGTEHSSGLLGNKHSTGTEHSSGLLGNKHSTGLTGSENSTGLVGNNHNSGLNPIDGAPAREAGRI